MRYLWQCHRIARYEMKNKKKKKITFLVVFSQAIVYVCLYSNEFLYSLRLTRINIALLFDCFLNKRKTPVKRLIAIKYILPEKKKKIIKKKIINRGTSSCFRPNDDSRWLALAAWSASVVWDEMEQWYNKSNFY